jgi:hypothetical protein
VVADERVRGRRVTLGGGRARDGRRVDADAALEHLGAQVADVSDAGVTDPAPRLRA